MLSSVRLITRSSDGSYITLHFYDGSVKTMSYKEYLDAVKLFYDSSPNEKK